MRFDTGTHDVYQLLVSSNDDGAAFDGLAEDTGIAREIVSAMRAGVTLQGAEGWPSSARRKTSPPSAASSGRRGSSSSEQSNSSVVFDDALILKVFRRVEAGINPELEMLRFLTAQGFRNIPALGGWYALLRRAAHRDARPAAGVRRRRNRGLGAGARRDRRPRPRASSTGWDGSER